MGNLTITASNVDWESGTRPRTVTGGATITRGQALRRDTTGEYVLSDASALNTADVDGISISDGTDGGQMLIAQRGATIDIGATTVAGTAYVLSATAGGICPITDLLATECPNLLFWGTGTRIVTLILEKSPVIIPA